MNLEEQLNDVIATAGEHMREYAQMRSALCEADAIFGLLVRSFDAGGVEPPDGFHRCISQVRKAIEATR
jgi:hypothetical protein